MYPHLGKSLNMSQLKEVELRIYKDLNTLRTSTVKDSVYFVFNSTTQKVSEIWVTNKNNVPKQVELTGDIVASIQNTDGNLTITGTDTITINISEALLSTINSALQSGDNISELVNDASYITLADVTTPTLQEVSDAGGFDNGSTVREGNIGGISLVCSIAKELNWKEGVLRSYSQSDANSKANPIIGESPITYVGQEFKDLINFSTADPITDVISIEFEGDLRAMNTAFHYENTNYRLYLYDLDNNILGIGKYDSVTYNDVDLSVLDLYDVENIKSGSTINAVVRVVGREYDNNTLATIEEVERRIEDKGFVPYTGAIQDVDLGNKDIYTGKVWLYDEPNDNHGSIHYTDGNLHIEDADGHKLLVIEDEFMQIHKNDTIQSNLWTSGLTETRDHYLPDANGTIALVENLEEVYIPYTGTTQPITGDLEFGDNKDLFSENEDRKSRVNISAERIILERYNKNNENGTSIILGEEYIEISASSSTAKGLKGTQDFSPNITDLDYTQKIYVDNAVTDAVDGVELQSNKGEPNGYAPLNASATIDLEYLPDAILGQLVHGGMVNCATMVATLTNNAKTKLGTALATITLTNDTTAITGYVANEGIYYIATTDGTFAGISFLVGDWLISTGASWQKVDNTDAVASVNGQTGVVSLTTANVAENTNLYFTTARVLSTLLSGLSLATGGAIVSTDSILTAFGKLQKQITDAISQLFWTVTGDNIRNNNAGNIELKMNTGKKVSFLNNSNTEVANVDIQGNFGGNFGYFDTVEFPTSGKGIRIGGNGSNFFRGFIGSRWESDILIKYVSDLSANYDARSLIDKGFLDAQLASSLNKTGDTITGDIGNTSTGFFRVASGTTAQRPVTPLDGMIRYNTTTQRNEFYMNGAWRNHARLEGDTFTGNVLVPSIQRTNGSGYYKQEDGGTEWHNVRWFTPTGTFSSTGTSVTTTGSQLTSAMVGSKIGVGTDKRTITAFLTANTCTVDSAFSTNYVNEPLANWGVFSRLMETNSSGQTSLFTLQGQIWITQNAGLVSAAGVVGSGGNFQLGFSGLDLATSNGVRFSNSTNSSSLKDVGLRRNSAGVVEVYDGVTNGAFRDLRLRNVIADGVVRLKNYTVATLPTGTQGDTAYVTDALSPTYRGVVVGGGSVVTQVFFNGTNWLT